MREMVQATEQDGEAIAEGSENQHHYRVDSSLLKSRSGNSHCSKIDRVDNDSDCRAPLVRAEQGLQRIDKEHAL